MRLNFKPIVIVCLLLSFCLVFSGCAQTPQNNNTDLPNSSQAQEDKIPEYNSSPFSVVSDNQPEFQKDEITNKSFETYSELDSLGRCGVAFACVGVDIMPTEDRGEIGQVKPSGWHTVKYDIVDGKYLYNRCHLIGFQLTGENANRKNLITGTRYFNVDGMLPFENMVADYVKETKNHVMYRVTPVYEDQNLVANGVQMEAYSVEDNGEGICFNVFVYNVQPGVTINYLTGESSLSSDAETNSNDIVSNEDSNTVQFVLNTSSKKFHLPSCTSVKKIAEENKKEYKGTREELINEEYSPCKNCNP